MIRRGRAQDLMQARREPGSDLPRTPHGRTQNLVQMRSGHDASGVAFFCDLASRITGERLANTAFDIGGGQLDGSKTRAGLSCPRPGRRFASKSAANRKFPAGGGGMAAPMPGMAEDRGACRAIPQACVSKNPTYQRFSQDGRV